MENESQHSVLDFNFDLDDTAKNHLSEIAKWAKINAIIAFVSVGISILQSLMLLTKMGSAGSKAIGAGFISWALSILLNILLLNASKNINLGLVNSEQGVFNQGLNDLAKYLRVIGILCIVIGVIFLLIFLIALMVGAGRGFR
jgi:type IV secretory pathway VirB6-like protein